MEDYESGEWPIAPFKDDIVKRCKEILKKGQSRVRLGYVILDEMKLEYSKSDLLEILGALEETGKYHSRFVKHKNGRDDFIIFNVPKKSWKERYWVLVEAFKYIIGGVIGVIIAKLFGI